MYDMLYKHALFFSCLLFVLQGISAGRPPLPGTKPSAQPSGLRQSDGVTSQQRSRGPALGVNNLHKVDHGTLNSKFHEADDLGNKVGFFVSYIP